MYLSMIFLLVHQEINTSRNSTIENSNKVCLSEWRVQRCYSFLYISFAVYRQIATLKLVSPHITGVSSHIKNLSPCFEALPHILPCPLSTTATAYLRPGLHDAFPQSISKVNLSVCSAPNTWHTPVNEHKIPFMHRNMP